MSPQRTVTDIHQNNAIRCLAAVITLLNELSDAFGTPFVPAISNTTLSLITAVQNVKKNKEDCIQLLENVYQLLCAIINLHIKSETKGNLPPATLNHVGKFMETLHKIHTFVEAQQDGSKIKSFFRQTETKTLLSECRAGLQQAFEVFKTKTNITALGYITQMQEEAEIMHKEVLELISSWSDGTASDRSSSIYKTGGSQNSSNSISLLPAKPKIFHGREQELKEIVDILQQESPRIAILGAGGMGKTSLAKAALHHPDIAAKYEQCFFVVADSVTTNVGLSGLIGEHIGFEPAKDATTSVLQYFATHGPSLLILDNLETPWEPLESRGDVEELLSKLTDLPHLALMITMRGAERPAKVQWTHPFLTPLKPLSDVAARDTFFAIAEDVHDSKDVNEILSLTDNMPLVVDLIAHAVDFEGSCSAVLARWKSERTSLISVGNDRKSDLDTSITISLSSSRMSTGAKDLLSLLSILPDGLSNVELLQSKLSINDIMTCKATLLATSLAYMDDKRRLKSLVPIREHMQCFYPPSPLLIHPLQKYFHQVLDLYRQYPITQQGAGRVKHISLNVRNMGELLLRGLNQDNPHLAETIDCTLSMKVFMGNMGSGYHHPIAMLMDQIEAVLAGSCDERFKAQLILWKFESRSPCLSTDADLLITQAISHFHNLNDPALECNLYDQVGLYYFHTERELSVGL
ncbi:P-loop containing nucleoside triphosphate hydrolase protein, partial [Mycena latifolia]